MGAWGSACRVKDGLALTVEGVACDVLTDGLGDEVADRLAGADASAHDRRGDTDRRHLEEPGALAAVQARERTLDGSEHRDLVVAGRVGLQDAMRDAMVAVVEGAVGRRVRSFMSANDLEGNLQTEVFVLEGIDAPDVVDEPPTSR